MQHGGSSLSPFRRKDWLSNSVSYLKQIWSKLLHLEGRAVKEGSRTMFNTVTCRRVSQTEGANRGKSGDWMQHQQTQRRLLEPRGAPRRAPSPEMTWAEVVWVGPVWVPSVSQSSGARSRYQSLSGSVLGAGQTRLFSYLGGARAHGLGFGTSAPRVLGVGITGREKRGNWGRQWVREKIGGTKINESFEKGLCWDVWVVVWKGDHGMRRVADWDTEWVKSVLHTNHKVSFVHIIPHPAVFA